MAHGPLHDASGRLRRRHTTAGHNTRRSLDARAQAVRWLDRNEDILDPESACQRQQGACLIIVNIIIE